MARVLCAWIAAFTLFFACDDSPTDPGSSKTPGTPLTFSDAINVIWYLDEFKVSGQQGDAVDLEPFTFIIGDSTFVGFDGCNWYGGNLELEDNKISLSDIASTEIACHVAVFPSNQLLGTFDLEISTKRLVLTRPDKVLTFCSDATNDVKESTLIGKTWQATDSNAPEFDLLKSLDLLPRLEFEESRQFRVEWYCSNDNILECNSRIGFFGLGDKNVILFWEHGGCYSSPPGVDNQDGAFVERILSSTSYSINADTLRLCDEKVGLFFEFSSQ